MKSTAAILSTGSEAATFSAGEVLARVLEAGDVVLLSGDLGAGKTQLAKGIASGLGVPESVTSPTFNILLVHRGRLVLHHVDLYRLDTADQLDDIDYWGILESGGVTVVEWGDRFSEAAPPEHLGVRLTIDGDTSRSIEVTGHGERGESLAASWFAACEGVDSIEVSVTL